MTAARLGNELCNTNATLYEEHRRHLACQRALLYERQRHQECSQAYSSLTKDLQNLSKLNTHLQQQLDEPDRMSTLDSRKWVSGRVQGQGFVSKRSDDDANPNVTLAETASQSTQPVQQGQMSMGQEITAKLIELKHAKAKITNEHHTAMRNKSDQIIEEEAESQKLASSVKMRMSQDESMMQDEDDNEDEEPMSGNETDIESDYSEQHRQFRRPSNLRSLRPKDASTTVQHT